MNTTIKNQLNAVFDLTALRLAIAAYAGLGLFVVLIAEGLDNQEPAPYAAYYVGAVNESISPKFWDLLSDTSLLLLCLSLPAAYLSRRHQALSTPAKYLCRINNRLFLLAFTLGATAWGILLAQIILRLADGAYPAAWGNLFFDAPGFLILVFLPLLNSLWWCAAQTVAQPDSAALQWLFDKLGKYTWPVYGVFTGLVVFLVVNQQ
ncbi:MAG: hypothetical protein PHH59_09000 [Methylovulum sp.]|uniref:hypothetical protein n=1 Tax=Methylovulum sp. TaxID=1916980 RepID=UPI00262E19A2|nr:hypothetical protein [Methylovulum sp.]MDD2724140.1 hypothetical protein [Methylovulum sp.]MDD5123172.1 hypothetical protein [Methylovulum sp.]